MISTVTKQWEIIGAMNYEDLRQWRDICEFLDEEWYKFIAADDSPFSLLTSASRPVRSQLWSDYMIQFVKWGDHPYSHHHSGREARRYGKILGWRLTLGWEAKIDFLEQVVLLNRAPEDLPQPWRRAIWESFFKREEIEELRRIEADRRWQQRLEESLQRRQASQANLDMYVLWCAQESGDCPITGNCHMMTGAITSKSCPNFEPCKNLWRAI